mmetsp:Transcript_39366/g.92071  ORF Transcript_39366/g.92071 Transcript_39366/m.92071 type:complete len:278 (-) Transcript_39366:203-1036(-)
MESTGSQAAQAGAVLGHEGGSTALPYLCDSGWAVFPSLLERYYTRFVTSNSQSLHVHSNGLCVLGVDSAHPQLAPPRKVTAVKYRQHDSKNLLENGVRGKKKSGAVFMLPRDMLCEVMLDDGSSFTVYATVRASVIEINRRLLERPELVGDPSGCGYIAVLQPKMDEKHSIGQACLEFDAESPLTEPSGNAKRKLEGKRVRTAAKRQERERQPCWMFAKRGECKYGDKCRFAHEPEQGSAAGFVSGGGADVLAPVVAEPEVMSSTEGDNAVGPDAAP